MGASDGKSGIEAALVTIGTVTIIRAQFPEGTAKSLDDEVLAAIGAASVAVPNR